MKKFISKLKNIKLINKINLFPNLNKKKLILFFFFGVLLSVCKQIAFANTNKFGSGTTANTGSSFADVNPDDRNAINTTQTTSGFSTGSGVGFPTLIDKEGNVATHTDNCPCQTLPEGKITDNIVHGHGVINMASAEGTINQDPAHSGNGTGTAK